MEPSYKEALQQIINFLGKLEEKEGIKYYLVGGILVNLYSDFRITRDIDLVIDLEATKITIGDFIYLLQQNNFFPYQDWSSTAILARESKIIQVLDKNETVKYDIHLIERISQNKFKKIGPIALKRKVKETIFGIECWVISKEDFIISKLVYGGWQDYTDALGCWMRFNDELDVKYMDKISLELNIQKELDLLKSGIDDPDEYFKKVNGY